MEKAEALRPALILPSGVLLPIASEEEDAQVRMQPARCRPRHAKNNNTVSVGFAEHW
jgi:hypothetical protein